MKRRVGDSEEIDLVLELSTDLDEEELPARKKKPKINNTRKKGESRKRSRKTSPSFMDTLGEALEDDIQAKIARVNSRPLSKYEQLREKNIAETKKMENEILFGGL